MTSNEVGMQLHDRATKGETLTPDEQSQLENWYTIQDMQESELLEPQNALSDNSHLRTQIDTVLDRLTSTIQRIQKITAENETIRDEIGALRQQLDSVKSA